MTVCFTVKECHADFFWHERQTASTSTAFQEQTARNCAPPLPNLNYVPSVFSLKATWRDIHKHLSSQTHSTKFVMWPKLLIYYWQSEVFGQVGIFRSWSPCSLDTFTRTPAVHFLLLIQYMVIGWVEERWGTTWPRHQFIAQTVTDSQLASSKSPINPT